MTAIPNPSTQHLDFASLIGQDKAKEILRKSFHNSRMGHAFLFRGPTGVGKKRAARTFAAYINCQSHVGDDACGHCSSCHKFASNNHPDILVIEPDGVAIKIKQVRELIQALAFPPYEAMMRVVILTDVHTMRREAANSMLKTLEEPPPNTVLVLTADATGDILPTIVSRCQEVHFFGIPYEDVAATLVAQKEIPTATAAAVAAITEGSLGRALLLYDRDLLPLRTEILAMLLEMRAEMPESVEQVFGLAEKSAALKEDLAELLNLLRILFRDLLLYQTTRNEHLLVNRDLSATLVKAENRWSFDGLCTRLDRIRLAEKQLHRNCNRTHVCEMLFFDLL